MAGHDDVAIMSDFTHDFAISRRDVPELCKNHSPLKKQGAGNAGRSMRPQPRV
jgi:hypothetical protein